MQNDGGQKSSRHRADDQKADKFPIHIAEAEMHHKTRDGDAYQYKHRGPDSFKRPAAKHRKPYNDGAAAAQADQSGHGSTEKTEQDGFERRGQFLF